MASPENIPLQILKDLSSQTPSDKCMTSSNSDILNKGSKLEDKEDTRHPSTIVDNQRNEHSVMDGNKLNDMQQYGVSKDGHGDMPEIKSTILPELVADDGDVLKSIALKSFSESIAYGHDEMPKTAAPETISDDHGDIQKTLAPQSRFLLEDDHGDKMKTTASNLKAEDPNEVAKIETLESKSESISDDGVLKKQNQEPNSEEVEDEHDDTLQTESLPNKAITDSTPFDVELDLVLDDQVMSFVNLAISNATDSLRSYENVERCSAKATITDETKDMEKSSERVKVSEKTCQDEKQSVDDNTCQFKENENQQQSLILSSEIVDPENVAEVNANDTKDAKMKIAKEPTILPGDLTTVDTTNYPIVVDMVNDDDSVDLTKVSSKEAVEQEQEESKESESQSQNSKCNRPDAVDTGIQSTTTSKDSIPESLFPNGKGDVQEELAPCFTENMVQDDLLMAAKSKEEYCLLHINEGHQYDNNDMKTKVLSVNVESDFQKKDNDENKQDKISAMTTTTEKGRLVASGEDDFQKQNCANIKDKPMKTSNESDNQYQRNESSLQQKDNVENAKDKLNKTNGKGDQNTNDSRNEEVGIPVKKVNGAIDVRVSAGEDSDKKLSEELLKDETRQDDCIRDSGLALVNDRLRIRIAELQSQIKEISCQLAFVGDRNWRLEAYMECLIHTLEKMGVTDIEDLDQTTLSLELFKVKVKAGYRLGPYNGLPQRARRSYKRDGITPPTIDLSGGSLACHTSKDGNSKLAFSISGTDDIGLSVRQMQQYEANIETLTMKNHFLETQLQLIRNTYPNIGVLQPQDGPFPLCQPAPQEIYQPAPPTIEQFGFPTAPINSLPPPPTMLPMVPQIDINNNNTNIASCMTESMTTSQQPLPPMPPTEADRPKVSKYVPPPRFQKQYTESPTSTPNGARQNVSGSGRFRNDGWYRHGRSATNVTTSGPAWRTERTSHSSAWRKPCHFN